MVIFVTGTNREAYRVVFPQTNPRPQRPFDARPAAAALDSSYAACMTQASYMLDAVKLARLGKQNSPSATIRMK